MEGAKELNARTNTTSEFEVRAIFVPRKFPMTPININCASLVYKEFKLIIKFQILPGISLTATQNAWETLPIISTSSFISLFNIRIEKKERTACDSPRMQILHPKKNFTQKKLFQRAFLDFALLSLSSPVSTSISWRCSARHRRERERKREKE